MFRFFEVTWEKNKKQQKETKISMKIISLFTYSHRPLLQSSCIVRNLLLHRNDMAKKSEYQNVETEYFVTVAIFLCLVFTYILVCNVPKASLSW